MTDQRRVQLAEAMGWRNCEPKGYVNVDGEPTCCPAGEPPPFDAPPYIAALPDPFTDANDDYAVLEWMRELPGDRMPWGFASTTEKYLAWNYKIGDYARAALKVLSSTESGDSD